MVFKCSITKNDAYLNIRFSKYWKKLPFKIFGYSVYVDNRYPKYRHIYIYDHTHRQAVMRLNLRPVLFNGINFYNVDSAYVHPEYQGRSIGLNLYKKLITEYQINLLTVGSHSRGARKVWNDLADTDSINAYGILSDGSKIWRCRADKKKRQIQSRGRNPKVYSGKEGVGIVLVEAGSLAESQLVKIQKEKSKSIDILKTPKCEFHATIYS